MDDPDRQSDDSEADGGWADETGWSDDGTDDGGTDDDGTDDGGADDSEWDVGVDDVGGDAGGGEAAVGPAGGSDWRGHAKTIGAMLGLVVVAFVMGILAIVVLSVGLIVAGVEVTETDSLFVSLVGIQGIGFPLTAYGYLRYTDREFQRFIPTRVPSLKEILLIVGSAVGALVLVAITASVLVSLLSTEPAANSGGQTVAENPEIVPYLLPFVFLLNGPGEELLFRGVIQGRFREDYGGPVAIVLASLMFAPAHIVSLVGSPQAAAITISILTVPSLVFGAVYEYTDNFTVPALVHGLYNSILFGSIYLVSVYGDGVSELIVF